MAHRLDDVERWFVHRGVPHFIRGYAASTDIWTRALPVLLIAYLGVGMNALDINGWSLTRNLLVAGLVVAMLVGAWATANLTRRRPWHSRPSTVGVAELAVFIVGPALPAALFGQWRDAFESVAWSLAVLGLIYAVTSYGIVPLIRWALGTTRTQALTFLNVLLRVLPLLLLFITFLFINAEVWQLAGTLTGWPYAMVIAVFVLLGVLFILTRVPGTMRGLSTFEDWAEVAALIASTPAEHLATPRHGPCASEQLSRREKLNIGLVTIFSQGLQITFVAVAVFVFFVGFGLLTVTVDIAAAWTGLIDVSVYWRSSSGRYVLSEPLVRVAGFLAAFTGMYFTVAVSTDSTYRDEVAEDVAPQIRQALAVRAAYRWRETRGSDLTPDSLTPTPLNPDSQGATR